MPLLEGQELCSCGHKREEHLQRSREHRLKVKTWIDAKRDPAPKLKLAGCLLCTCGGFLRKRGRTL